MGNFAFSLPVDVSRLNLDREFANYQLKKFKFNNKNISLGPNANCKQPEIWTCDEIITYSKCLRYQVKPCL